MRVYNRSRGFGVKRKALAAILLLPFIMGVVIGTLAMQHWCTKHNGVLAFNQHHSVPH